MSNQNVNQTQIDNKGKGAAFSGVLAALAASSCCIPPVIAAIAGIGGIAGSMSWIEPLRPYLMGFAVLAIGYAWYNHYQGQKMEDCCAVDAKPKWYQTKNFLIGITLFATASMAFPYYSHIFFPSNDKKEVLIINSDDLQNVTYNIEGMTCGGCASHVETDVNKLPGIVSVDASYEEAVAKVEFDKSKVSLAEIEAAINGTGYTVIGKK